jgi:hypothetical protein
VTDTDEQEQQPSTRDLAIAAICRELTSARIVRTGSPTAVKLAALFPKARTDDEAWEAYEAEPCESSVLTVDYGGGPDGATGITAAATIGRLVDAVLDAIGDEHGPRTKLPFGFTAPR